MQILSAPLSSEVDSTGSRPAAPATRPRPRPRPRADVATTPNWVDHDAFAPWVAIWDESYDAAEQSWAMGPDGVLLPSASGTNAATTGRSRLIRLLRRR